MSLKNHQMTTREEFMSFFRDNKKVSTLSDEDKVEIASQFLLKDQSLVKNLLIKLKDKYDHSIYQFMEESNSLPVF